MTCVNSATTESITEPTYQEIKLRAKQVWTNVCVNGRNNVYKLAAEPAEEHAAKLERGFYRNEPEYIKDGDFWINAEVEDSDFWDFLD